MERNENRPARQFHLDLLRMIACLLVVMIHVSAEFVVRGNEGPDFWWGIAFDSLARAGVPLFVMISGALMLDENYVFTVKKWLGHIVRMAVFYVVWLNVSGLIGSPDYHLWFAPMIIGVYLLVPMLRLWVNEANKRWVEVFLIISLVFSFIMPQARAIAPRMVGKLNTIGWLEDFAKNFDLGFAPGYAAYFVLGWYLNRGVLGWKPACLLGIAGLAMTFGGTAWATLTLRMNGYPFYENFTVNVLAYSTAIFAVCRACCGRADGFGGRFVRWIGRCSLGIYAVHLSVISELMGVFGGMHPAPAIPVIFVLTVAVSAAVSMILRLIPLVKKIA